MTAILWLVIGVLPISLSLWALLDAARRPPWAWSLAGRSQVAWLAGILFGVFLLLLGVAISGWYLIVVRPTIAAVEDGDFGALDAPKS